MKARLYLLIVTIISGLGLLLTSTSWITAHEACATQTPLEFQYRTEYCTNDGVAYVSVLFGAVVLASVFVILCSLIIKLLGLRIAATTNKA